MWALGDLGTWTTLKWGKMHDGFSWSKLRSDAPPKTWKAMHFVTLAAVLAILTTCGAISLLTNQL